MQGIAGPDFSRIPTCFTFRTLTANSWGVKSPLWMSLPTGPNWALRTSLTWQNYADPAMLSCGCKVWTLFALCVVHYLTTKGKALGVFSRVPGEIKRLRDLRGGRWSWTLTFAQKRSWVGRWSWAEQVGRLLLRVVQVVHQQRCNGHCLSDSVQHSSWKNYCAVHKSLGNGEGTPS